MDAFHAVAVRVNGVDLAGEAAAHDVVQDGPADGGRPAARADHRHGPRLQHRPQARHVGPALPARYRVQVTVHVRVCVVTGQREGQLNLTVGEGAVDRQPALANTPSMAALSSSAVAVNAVSPRRRASDTRCSSSSVATPR